VTQPFMEHPGDEDFLPPIDSMADAITRLRALPEWEDWITFQAQGICTRVDSYHFADILMRNEVIKLRKSVAVDLDFVARRARVPRAYLTRTGRNTYSLGRATPKQSARVLHAIFRDFFGILPHPDEEDDIGLMEDDDYAVSAEW